MHIVEGTESDNDKSTTRVAIALFTHTVVPIYTRRWMYMICLYVIGPMVGYTVSQAHVAVVERRTVQSL
jgi:hypothetical protein